MASGEQSGRGGAQHPDKSTGASATGAPALCSRFNAEAAQGSRRGAGGRARCWQGGQLPGTGCYPGVTAAPQGPFFARCMLSMRGCSSRASTSPCSNGAASPGCTPSCSPHGALATAGCPGLQRDPCPSSPASLRPWAMPARVGSLPPPPAKGQGSTRGKPISHTYGSAWCYPPPSPPRRNRLRRHHPLRRGARLQEKRRPG